MKFCPILFILLFTSSLMAQQAGDLKKETGNQKVVVITGARFSYKIVQKWIDDFYLTNPDFQIIIEARGSADPSSDILAEVYEHDEAVRATREYVKVGRYAVLPVAYSGSAFAESYGKKGLTTDLIKQLYFHDPYADNDNRGKIKSPYTVYTRLQKAGVPYVFARYFGFEQKEINGKAIAGSDEHLLKALVRDSAGISYLPTPLIYDPATGKTIQGLTVLPVDLDGNGKISDAEKFYDDQAKVIQKLEAIAAKDIRNVPIAYLHLSVDKRNASPEAMVFLRWVKENGQAYLSEWGYLQPEGKVPENDLSH